MKHYNPLIFNVLDIVKGTTVDGPGFRTSIYLSGCKHCCRGCHNPQSWNPLEGKAMTLENILEIVEEEDFDVTITGGDPLYHPSKLETLVKAIKENRRNIWIYTGFIWEDILNSPLMLSAIKDADVLIDGPFIEELKDLDLPFRGSSNQRIINVSESIRQKEIVLIERK